MNTLNSMKCAAVLLPALAIGIPMAHAGDKDCDCPCDPEKTTVAIGSDRDKQDSDQRVATTLPAKPASESAKSKANKTAFNDYLETKPVRGFHSDSLVGHDVMNRRNNESLGEVSNLLLDKNGQVVAVVVSVGGVLGIGERDLAIAWDQIERKVDGDKITLSVDLTEASLKDAPSYTSALKQDRQ